MLCAEANANFVDYAKRLARFLWTSKKICRFFGGRTSEYLPPGAK